MYLDSKIKLILQEKLNFSSASIQFLEEDLELSAKVTGLIQMTRTVSGSSKRSVIIKQLKQIQTYLVRSTGFTTEVEQDILK